MFTNTMCKAAYKRLVFKKDAVCKILDDLRTDYWVALWETQSENR